MGLREVPAPTRGSGAVTCCGGHRERCLFGRMHIWSVWYENAQLQRTALTFHCHDCGSVCTADEDEGSDGQPVQASGAASASLKHGDGLV
jgi:hypothetical protein